jgi:FAD/FMN-containing dehydrogenase
LNQASLAYALGNNPQKVRDLKEQLPAWVALVGIAGRTELPEERVAFQIEDISDIAQQFHRELLPELNGISGEEILPVILSPSREPYWKLGYQGACQDVFFITTLDQAPEMLQVMHQVAIASGYPISDIGVYLQPRHQGVNCHCEFSLPYHHEIPREVTRMQNLYSQASEALSQQGAFFTRPYGQWANLAFSRDPASTDLIQQIKNIFDPEGILNPGKLALKVKTGGER